MAYRLTKIYTRTGDDGTTSLDMHQRLSKDDVRIETVGALDELNSAIGMILVCKIQTTEIQTCLIQVQHNIFNLGGELCPPYRAVITPEHITQLEQWIDTWNTVLPPLKEFILPGANQASATCHMARTICRRAERRLVSLHKLEPVSPDVLRYVNRLSDLLFVAARILAKENNNEEICWEHK